MKRLSIRFKITLWFSIMLIAITAVIIGVILYINSEVLKKDIQGELITVVEDNIDEIEYYNLVQDASPDGDGDYYIEYNGGFLEIDDDFLDTVNGNYTALYFYDGMLVYGENPAWSETSDIYFEDSKVRTVKGSSDTYYIYDRKLDREGLEGLWLRGIVSSQSGVSRLNSIIKMLLLVLPAFVIVAIAGGYIIAVRILKPINYISEAASEICEGNDLKKRIELENGKDELHRLADAINSMIGRLYKSFEAEKRFSSDASHELRTPVSVISAQCEYTLEKPRTVDEYTQALTVVRRQADKMNKMISQMLEFTRLETNSDRYEKNKVDFSELIKLTCLDFQYIKEKNISLESSVEEGISVCGNYELLTRLVSNLLSNAYRYGKENGHIKVTLTSVGDEVRLSVADDGIGIANEDKEKIFDRFYQADKSRSGSGTGLGLSLVKEIAEFHAGRVTVESEPGKGSIFSYYMKKCEKR